MPRFITALLAVALLAPALALGEARPAAASAKTSSCTGWKSTIDPPLTIRVGRSSGAVEEVDFRTYVARVMAKEWNLRQPAALETAAVAVKQYAWFYALAGNWRRSYSNAAGECFDVRDTTADQIYRSAVTPLPRIWDAVDATWGLSVRKGNIFFMTGYRTGRKVACGADATGYRLFAKSVVACAKDGLTREEIQLIYYAPDVTFHWSGTAAGEVATVDVPISAPRVELLAGVGLGAAHARVTWDADRRRPQGTSFHFQRVVSGQWTDFTLPDATQTSLELYLKPGLTQGFRVRLRDEAGNFGAWYETGKFKPRLVQNANRVKGVLAWTGNWSRLKSGSASGGNVARTSKVGSTVTFNFTGRAVALVGTLGPKFGLARIWVDDVLEAEIDLYAPKNRWRMLLFSRQWDSSGAHTVRVELAGIKGRKLLHFDAALFHP